MAKFVSSVLVQESVSQVLSNLVRKYEERDGSNKDTNLERLEMAHTRLEAVLEISDRWQITDASLLRWRSKLKRVARECDDTLRSCKRRILEDEEAEKEARESSFPRRMRSFVSSIFRRPNRDELNSSVARRFEWFADGASEFVRLAELGGAPRRGHMMPFHPLNRHLLAGKKLHHRIIQENGRRLFLLLVPFTTSEYGIEARLLFIQKDGGEDDFLLSLMLQISESTDIVGITMKCVELFAPLFMSAVETIRNELMQLPMEDFSWVPNVDTHSKEQLDSILSTGTQWLRPDPLCCKQHDQHELGRHGSESGILGLAGACPEPVVSVNLQCRVSVRGCHKHRALLSELRNSQQQDSPSLKAGIVFSPHGYSQDYLHVDTAPVIAAVYTEKQHFLHTEFTTFGQLEEIMLPKAIDYFCKNEEATIYQMLWRSKHGTAYVHVEKPSTHGTKQRKDESMDWSYGVSHFVNLWATDAPIRLQGSIKDWIQKDMESQSVRVPCNTDRTRQK